MMEAAGVTEKLKACDPMRWVGLMNTLHEILSISKAGISLPSGKSRL